MIFSLKLQDCINAINLVDSRNESEEHLKSPISKFLSSTFYSENEINTKEKIDLAIYLGNDATSDIGVLIEAKSLVINLSSRQLNNSIKRVSRNIIVLPSRKG